MPGMTYDEAYRLIAWTVTLVVGVPCLWALWDVIKHR
jgi:hypothetical protein